LLCAIGYYWAFKPTSPTHTDAAHLHLPLSPKTSYDVDTKLQKELTDKKEFDAVDRLFQVLAWQQFIALNWPTGKDGKPMPQISDAGSPIWEKWEDSFEVFRDSGAAPTARLDLPAHLLGKVDPKTNPKILFRTNKSSHFHRRSPRDKANEIDQAL
jgi:hypothetical protein